MTNLWSLAPLWKSINLLNTANMLLLWYSTISFQVTAQSTSSNVCTPFSHYWPLFPTEQAGNITSVFLKEQFHCCGLFMLKWQSIKPQFLSPSLDTDSNASFRPCLFHNHNFPHNTWIYFLQVFHVYASIPPSPHLLPPISWRTPPSKSRLIGLNLCTYFAFSLSLQGLPVSSIVLSYYSSSVSVCISLWYFKRANTLRDFSTYWSSTLISLILLLSFLQRAAQCFGKSAILNTQRQWFWFTCSFWKQCPLNKIAAAVSAGF